MFLSIPHDILMKTMHSPAGMLMSRAYLTPKEFTLCSIDKNTYFEIYTTMVLQNHNGTF